MFTKSKIKSIRSIGIGEVWDITVAEDESYLAQGFVNHNSRDPNVQNWTAGFREMVIAKPDHTFINCDAGSFEFRAAAARSEEEYLIQTFEKRHEMLEDVLKIASKYGFNDADEVVKASDKKKISCTKQETELLHEFSNWDIHRRNGALIFECEPYEITPEQRQISKCVSLDSLVFHSKGLTKLGTLLPKNPKKGEFYPLPEGFKALTDEGFKDSPKIYYAGELEALEISTVSGRKIICSLDHKFRTFRNGKYVWVKAKKLTKDDDLFLRFNFDNLEEKTKRNQKDLVEKYSNFGRLFSERVVEVGSNYLSKVFIEGFSKKTQEKKQEFFELENLISSHELMESSQQCFKEFLKKALRTKDGNLFLSMPLEYLEVIQARLQLVGINSFLEREKKYTVEGVPLLKFNNGDQLKFFLDLIKKIEAFEKDYFIRTICPSEISKKIFYKEELSEDELKFVQFQIDNFLCKDRILSIKKIGSVPMGDLHVPSNNTVVYNGFVSHNTLGYCVAPDTKVLTKSYNWVKAKELKVNDNLWGFTEAPLKGTKRLFEESKVEALQEKVLPCYHLVFEDGTKVICSQEHMWLINNGERISWCETNKLKKGDSFPRYFTPWPQIFEGSFLERLNLHGRECNPLRSVVLKEIEFIGDHEVIAFETSSKTFFGEGFGSHNCLLYGGGPPRVMVSLMKDGFHYSLSDCISFQDRFFGNLPKIKEMISQIQKEIISKHYITSFMGRRRHFGFPPKYQSRAYRDACAKFLREATNAPFQMANADATKLAIVRLEDYFRSLSPSPAVVLNIHDELLVECHKSLVNEVAPLVKDVFTEACWDSLLRRVRVECSLSIRDRWGK